MEMERVIEFPHAHMDRRPRKRQRLGWDVAPQTLKVGMFCGQEVGNVTSFASSRAPSDQTLFVKGVTRNGSPPWREDDKDGHYVFALGDNITSRYKIHSKMGEVMHDLHLIHTDLKPENILLASPEHVKVPDFKASSRSPKDSSYFKRVPKSSAVKVIDFGSTTYDRQDQNYIVSTRHYRAPEVILGLGWSYPCDVWSVGCILVELCSGEALFQTHENLEHLAMMERGKLDWPEGAASRESIKAVLKLPRLQNLIMQHLDHSAGDLIHLLQGLLKYDPTDRLTACEALRHPFFTAGHLRRI
ncbi:LAMMER-type protein kinase AFC2 [Actinidia rufa]|uniref:LAMMER-type protein kinase AFC2 n=1 Tax=Actinidia rufa TaxID=165716 RepID=A0A7J0GMG5_9ERIC|nr:LAMMER-type protein kinase AFC2 [Actinidia rufa]